MAALDWSQCPAVESVPGKVSGAWVFRDTRLPVATVIENLEDLSVEEVMEQFDVTREQIAAVLEFVAQSLRESAPASTPVDAVVFDHGAPRGVSRALQGHTIITAEATRTREFGTSRIWRAGKLRSWCCPALRGGHGFACTSNELPRRSTQPHPAATPKSKSPSSRPALQTRRLRDGDRSQ